MINSSHRNVFTPPARPAREPAPDRDVAVTGEERRDQGEKCRQVGRQVDVHVREHGGVAVRPDGAQGASAPGEVDSDGLDVVESPHEVRSRIGYIPQAISVDGGITLKVGIGS